MEDKMLLEKIHVYVKESTVENYINILDKLNTLNIVSMKKFYGIYRLLLTEMDYIIEDRNLDGMGIFDDENYKYSYLVDDEDAKSFLAERVFESYENYVDVKWETNIANMVEELGYFDDNKFTSLFVRTHMLISLLECEILKQDDFWYPHSMYSIHLLKDSGYKLYKEKERIWQPKTGK